MRKLSLSQLFKTTAAFAALSATATDAGLLFLDRTGLLTVPGSWYFNAPLAVWSVVGLTTSIRIGHRLVQQVDPRPGRITAYRDHSPPLRGIPFTTNGQQSTLYASTVRTIFGGQPSFADDRRPTAWRVPIENNPVIVRETELFKFLAAAHRRDRHQFSRRYWTRQHRPRLDRLTYEAYMRLLLDNNLVDGRHEQGGASGRLVTRPRAALAYLKYDSPFTLAGTGQTGQGFYQLARFAQFARLGRLGRFARR